MQPIHAATLLFLVSVPALLQEPKPEFRPGTPVYRVMPSRGFPYGEHGCHNAALPKEEFAARRAAFLDELRTHGPGTVALVKSAPEASRNGDVGHEYRQDSDFIWLTGFPEAQALAIFDGVAVPVREIGAAEASEGDAKSSDAKTGTRAAISYTLLVLPKDPTMETWTGKRIGPEKARTDYGADYAATTKDTEAFVKAAVGRAKTLVLVNGFDTEFRKLVDKQIEELRSQQKEAPKVIDGRPWIGERRLIKSPAEIEMMKKACEVSVEGHLAAMRASKPGMNEGEIEAAAEFAFRALGGPRLGYPSICGAGDNGCVLHYNTNNATIGAKDLMLMDAAAEVGYYTADVTRTWPVNGKFTPEQKAIYEIVLRAQNAGIEKCKPGVTIGEVHDAAVKEVVKGLVDLGILQGSVPELVQKGAHRKVFMHGTSHWLGLDVHDSGDYQGKKRKLEPGMILTVEPGIYIADGTEGIDKKWWGIGVRIEDDILVTQGDPNNLTGRLPRDPAAIEAIVRSGQTR